MYFRMLIFLNIISVSCLKKDRLNQVDVNLKDPEILKNQTQKVEETDSFKDIAKDIKILADSLKNEKIDDPELSQMLKELNNTNVDDIEKNIENEEFVDPFLELEVEEEKTDKEGDSKIELILAKLASKETILITGGTIVFASSFTYFTKLQKWYQAISVSKRLRVRNIKNQAKINKWIQFAESNDKEIKEIFGKPFSDITIQDLKSLESKTLNKSAREWYDGLMSYLPKDEAQVLDKKSLRSILDKNLNELKLLNQLDSIIYDKRLNDYFSQNKKFPSPTRLRDYLVETVGTTIADAQELSRNYEKILRKNNLNPGNQISTSYSKRVNQVFLNDEFVEAQLKKTKNPVRISAPYPKPTRLSAAVAVIAGISYATFSLSDAPAAKRSIIKEIAKLEDRIWRLHLN